MAKTNSFSLYLAKEDVEGFDDLLTDKARGLLKSPEAKRISTKDIGDAAVLYVFTGHSDPPKWVSLLQPHFPSMPSVRSRSPCAIVAFKKENRIFALTYSYGHSYLDDAKTEAEFGLRVAINSVNDEKLRSVEKTNIGAAIRDYAQSAGLNNLRSLGREETLDLIRKVSGHTESSDFADKVSGARSLRFSAEMDLPDVPESAAEVLDLFKSQAYKRTAFAVIDQFPQVRDPSVAKLLDELALASIREGDDDFEIAIPGILPPESVGSFRFEGARISGWFVDLSMELYQESLGGDLEELTLEELKKHKVAAYADDMQFPLERCSVHHALVGSIMHDGERYAINEGVWYKISRGVRDTAEKVFEDVHGPEDAKFGPLTQRLGATAKDRAGYESERAYNTRIADSTGYLMMDGKLIKAEGGSEFEACDLLDLSGRRFIHVKKSSRKSSLLSHFFKQGSHAAELIRWDDTFRDGLLNRVKSDYGSQEERSLRRSLGSDDKWTIDFRIADFPRKNKKFNIPFFSKLSLRDESKKISRANFVTQLGFIRLSAIKKPKKPKA